MNTDMPKILGIITARGGSKSIPRKNIKELGGKPLIAYTIEAAKTSGVLDRVVLSTDDEEIAKAARSYGVDVPFMRPAELAEDTTPTLPVLAHAVQWLREHEDYAPDYVMILQPTAPLRQPFHITEAAERLTSSDADSLVSLTEAPTKYNPHWLFFADASGRMTLSTGVPVRQRIKRRQDFPPAYMTNGAIYLFKTHLLFDEDEPNFYGDNVLAYPMDEKYNVSIDDPSDWEDAERALEILRGPAS